MRSRLITILMFAAVAMPVFGDSIDDAEAKRRGVPVVVIQLENQLATEKKKTADLEKQLGELKKKLADLTAAPASPAPGDAAVGGGGTPTSGGGAAIDFGGPREASPLYDDFVTRYMNGDWVKLGTDLKAKEKEIAALPAGNAADLTYIKQAVAECRPAWWDQVVGVKTTQFKTTVWKQNVTVSFTNNAAPKFGGPVALNGGVAMGMSWPVAQMDSTEAMPMSDAGLNMNGNFTKGDGFDSLIWGYMAFGEMYGAVGAEKIKALTAAEKTQFNVYSGFRSGVTAAYYGTPGARRLMLVESLASFEKINDQRPDWLGKRPIGAAVMIELTRNRAKYKSIQITPILGLDKLGADGPPVELFLSKPVILAMAGTKLTFEEDRMMREMIKVLAEGNGSWNVPRISLPNKLSYDLNVQNDAALAVERSKFLNGG